MVRRGKEGLGLGTYRVRCPGRALLTSASSEARAADVLLFKTSVV